MSALVGGRGPHIAFQTQIQHDAQQSRVTIAIKISNLICPFPTDAELGSVVPDGRPGLNADVAHALLRLLPNVAEARPSREARNAA